MTNLAENLAAAAAARPDAIALKCDDLEYSYAAFDDDPTRRASSFGVSPGSGYDWRSVTSLTTTRKVPS